MRDVRRRGLALMMALMVPLVAPSVVRAAQTPEDVPPATIERDTHVFTVRDDGSIDEVDETVLRANTAAGVDEIAQRDIWFDRNVDRLDVVEAETITADGRHVRVQPDQIRDVQEPRSVDAPTFTDAAIRVVIFPAVGVGSRVRLVFHKVRTHASMPNQFSHLAEPPRMPIERQRLIFDLPADKPLHADARGYTALEPQSDGRRTRYEFDYSRTQFPRQESGAIAFASYGDRLLVTTVPDYATFAATYREGARDPSATDPRVLALAATLTRHLDDPRDKARAIYDWVRANIRYVALLLGETAAQPHRVVDILANRYGDCKDHVALFGALLSAAGIRNEPALLNLGAVYTLPSVPGYGGNAINHVIVWMPDLQLFADSTAGGTAFGFLPLSVMDRPALLVDDGLLVRTPATQPLGRTARLQIRVHADGDADYAYFVEDSGASAEPERNRLRRASVQTRAAIVADRLRLTGLQGSGAMSTSALDATDGPFDTTLDGTLDNFVWTTGTTAAPALTSFSGGIASQLRTALVERTRTQPYVCTSGDFKETAVLSFAPDFTVGEIPSDLELHDVTLDYSAHYTFDSASRTLQITRALNLHFPALVCDPEAFDANRAMLLKAERDALSQIVVRAREP
ncbi:DUF3857 domain-containing transglutaminase family protein [Pararobbsia silviterrae]|uniref:DUF3857 domain-containing protein n=1 Tax=Pararobbsia silviterrae TaxID=1792498 RepID=A0A494XYR8_9BURK|nr:DUF3857 and transglutaminase domain-containing protein [Pararobbsia silviterrae]RKP55657.1 DUF3857 domain-containing protein [Pararobbsia silviterrae]